MSKNIVEIHKELSKLKRELEKIPSADVREVVGVAFGGGPSYALVSQVREDLNMLWWYLDKATEILADMEVA